MKNAKKLGIGGLIATGIVSAAVLLTTITSEEDPRAKIILEAPNRHVLVAGDWILVASDGGSFVWDKRKKVYVMIGERVPFEKPPRQADENMWSKSDSDALYGWITRE